MNTLVEIPSWIVEQFELGDKARSNPTKVVHSVPVPGNFVDCEGDPLHVEVEFSSGRPMWWATITVSSEGEVVSESEPFVEILGLQEFFCTDPVDDTKTVEIRFECIEVIQTHQLDKDEALRTLSGLAQMPLTTEVEETDHYDAKESMDAFIDLARRLVYPYRVNARRN
jgi:hypothetical protein